MFLALINAKESAETSEAIKMWKHEYHFICNKNKDQDFVKITPKTKGPRSIKTNNKTPLPKITKITV